LCKQQHIVQLAELPNKRSTDSDTRRPGLISILKMTNYIFKSYFVLQQITSSRQAKVLSGASVMRAPESFRIQCTTSADGMSGLPASHHSVRLQQRLLCNPQNACKIVNKTCYADLIHRCQRKSRQDRLKLAHSTPILTVAAGICLNITDSESWSHNIQFRQAEIGISKASYKYLGHSVRLDSERKFARQRRTS
jgi:hypothetical protein